MAETIFPRSELRNLGIENWALMGMPMRPGNKLSSLCTRADGDLQNKVDSEKTTQKIRTLMMYRSGDPIGCEKSSNKRNTT